MNIEIINEFQLEMNRILTPKEKEIIEDWLNNEGFTEEQIRSALKEAVFNGVTNLKYIYKILKSFKLDENSNIENAKGKNDDEEEVKIPDWLV